MPEQIWQPPTIETRKCRKIPVEKAWDLTTEEIEEDEIRINLLYADRRRRRDRKGPNGQYNCHGLTFLNRRAFMHPSAIGLVLEDDDYFEIGDIADVKPGDIAVYYSSDRMTDIEHTGIVVNVDPPHEPGGVILTSHQQASLNDRTIWILSKWGYGPEVEHPVDYGPYTRFSGHIVYMREGKYDNVTDYRRH
jgi:hypothetical protein